MKIEEAVNNMLNQDMCESRQFVDLMTRLYERLDAIPDLEESMAPDAFEAVDEVISAIGEFVPA